MPDWTPFDVLSSGERPPPPRPITVPEGVGDRLRSAAFAELQALTAFRWAVSRWPDSPQRLKDAWLRLAEEEDKHLGWLLSRMNELGFGVRDRPVSTHLWDSFEECVSARQFTERMAGAEKRGQSAGERFASRLAAVDPTTAAIFEQVAKEEAGHIALAERFLPLLSLD